MGAKATKLQIRKALDELLKCKDEVQQRTMWKSFVEGKEPSEAIINAFLPSDIEFLRKQNYGLYRNLILDVIQFP